VRVDGFGLYAVVSKRTSCLPPSDLQPAFSLQFQQCRPHALKVPSEATPAHTLQPCAKPSSAAPPRSKPTTPTPVMKSSKTRRARTWTIRTPSSERMPHSKKPTNAPSSICSSMDIGTSADGEAEIGILKGGMISCAVETD
jgi:hypothetical protein